MMFASCGNVDNPLETIGTGGEENPFISVLAGALDDGATVTIDLEACIMGQAKTATATFEKDGNNFTLKSLEGDIVNVIKGLDPDQGHDYTTASATEILGWGGLKIDFKYDLSKNQLKASMEATRNGNTYYPISTIVFNLSDDTYSQYTYPYQMGYFILNDISVKGDKKIKLISTDYEKTAIIGNAVGIPTTRVAHTRSAAPGPYACVFYKDGETWADVNKRYEEVAGNALFVGDEDLDQTAFFLEQSFFPYYFMRYYGGDKVTYEDQVGYFNGAVFEGIYQMEDSSL